MFIRERRLFWSGVISAALIRGWCLFEAPELIRWNKVLTKFKGQSYWSLQLQIYELGMKACNVAFFKIPFNHNVAIQRLRNKKSLPWCRLEIISKKAFICLPCKIAERQLKLNFKKNHQHWPFSKEKDAKKKKKWSKNMTDLSNKRIFKRW